MPRRCSRNSCSPSSATITLFAPPCMDNIIVYSDTWSDHLSHIEIVLDKLRESGLTANPSKCKWGGRSMEFLGHQVGSERMMMPAHRAQGLGECNMPTTKNSLHAFLGAIGFYHRLVRRQFSFPSPQSRHLPKLNGQRKVRRSFAIFVPPSSSHDPFVYLCQMIPSL